jgi:F-type H+-transporting ATPase subunit a
MEFGHSLLHHLAKYLHFLEGIPEVVIFTWLIMAFIITIALLATKDMKNIPKGIQNVLESAIEYLNKFLTEIIGPEGPRFLPLFVTLTLFIFLSNLLGLVPGFEAPTGNWNTTIALALIVFFTTHYLGIKRKGFIGYLRHFCGPVWWMAPIMFPIELISEIARPFSLSVRLFANMLAKHIIMAVLALIIIIFANKPILYVETIFLPFVLPPFVFCIGVLACLIQTFIFILLSAFYISGAIKEEHH